MRVMDFATPAVGDDLSQKRWSVEEAKAWYARQAYLIGANYAPASAVNQLEMWQKETFDPARIDLELGWAENAGMNTVRVFLHDLAYQQDPEGFLNRVDQFLSIAAKHNIKPMLVIFDSVWDPNPKAGPQPAPLPGVHNSRWVQSPGAEVLKNWSAHRERLKDYVQAVIGRFGQDDRVNMWDLWNEPCNINSINPNYHAQEPARKIEMVSAYLPEVFGWARELKPAQPLTTGVWIADWSAHEKMHHCYQKQLELSDIITFHNYGSVQDFTQRVNHLRRYGRPVICTETMARSECDVAADNNDDAPIVEHTVQSLQNPDNSIKAIFRNAAQMDVGMMMWGLVEGKIQTHLPWHSIVKAYEPGQKPKVPFHDLFDPYGIPYCQEEIDILREIRNRGPVRSLEAA